MGGRWAAIAVVVAALGLTHVAEAQTATASEPRLEAALQLTVERFDTLLFIEAARSAMSGIFELYCAIGMFIPDRVGEGPDGVDVALGAACLVGSVANLVISALRIAAANDDDEERDRLHRFDEAAADGLDTRELDLFEAELEDGASDSRLRRGVSIGMGTALLIASGILIGFTAAGEVDELTGTTIGTALGLAGLLSLGSLFVETPYEAAANAFRAAR
jgi:hypothetical protein